MKVVLLFFRWMPLMAQFTHNPSLHSPRASHDPLIPSHQPCRLLHFIILLSVVLVSVQISHSTENDRSAAGIASKSNWRIGIVVRAKDGPCRGVFASTPVPTDWPEQKVHIIGRDVSQEVQRLRFRRLTDGVRQMVIEVPRLREGKTASALLTFEVSKLAVPPLSNPAQFAKPKRPSRHLFRYLNPSPMIESRNPEIMKLSKSIGVPDQSDWDRTEAIYEWVRENVRYHEGPLKGALTALQDSEGDCEELSSLFIALCRAQGIPARTVWIPGHCYSEFHLQRSGAKGEWIPCQLAGHRSFGEMTESRPILQKGDSFRIPGDPEKRLHRYAQMVGSLPGKGFVHPQIEIVHERIATEPNRN